MTHVVREPSTKSFGGQSVIAVFDDWTSLQAVLEDFAGEKERGATSVLYSPRAIAPPTARSRFWKRN